MQRGPFAGSRMNRRPRQCTVGVGGAELDGAGARVGSANGLPPPGATVSGAGPSGRQRGQLGGHRVDFDPAVLEDLPRRCSSLARCSMSFLR